LEGLVRNSRWWERKEAGKKVNWNLTAALLCTSDWPLGRGQSDTFNVIMKGDVWSPRDAHTRLTTRKRTVRHFQYHHGRWCLITKRRAYTNNICLYLIIFIFIKRLNYPLFKLRKPWWKMKKPLNYNFNLLCNQRVQRLKSY